MIQLGYSQEMPGRQLSQESQPQYSIGIYEDSQLLAPVVCFAELV